MDVDDTDNSFHLEGQDQVGLGKKSYTHSKQMAKYSEKSTWGYWPNKESHCALRNMERSITGEVLG